MLGASDGDADGELEGLLVLGASDGDTDGDRIGTADGELEGLPDRLPSEDLPVSERCWVPPRWSRPP